MRCNAKPQQIETISLETLGTHLAIVPPSLSGRVKRCGPSICQSVLFLRHRIIVIFAVFWDICNTALNNSSEMACHEELIFFLTRRIPSIQYNRLSITHSKMKSRLFAQIQNCTMLKIFLKFFLLFFNRRPLRFGNFFRTLESLSVITP